MHNIRLYGGIYGQNWYGVARDRIHQRSTGYGSALYSRLVAKEPLPYWSALTWKAPAKKTGHQPVLRDGCGEGVLSRLENRSEDPPVKAPAALVQSVGGTRLWRRLRRSCSW